ncbi:hypothetical protein [Allohahella marinimesophila]
MKHRLIISALAVAFVTAAAVTVFLVVNESTPNSLAEPVLDPAQQSAVPGASMNRGAAAADQSSTGSSPGRGLQPSTPLDPEELELGDNPDYPTLESRLTEMHARREHQSFKPDQVLAAIRQPAAWQSDDSVAEQMDLPDEDRYDGRTFIRFNALKVETLMPGDTMEIPIEQANSIYQMVVDEVEDHRDGSITWRGHLQDFNEENQVMITQSDGVTYAGIFTPDAPYTIEARGDAGWVVTTGTLFKGEEEPLPIPVPDIAESRASH